MVDVVVRYHQAPGGQPQPPHALQGVPLEEHTPLTVAHTYQGRLGIRTDWWAATTGKLVPCGTLKQTDTAMVLDVDPDITCFTSNPAEVQWSSGGRHGTIVPAFFARTVGGKRLAVMRPWKQGPDGQVEAEVMHKAAQAAHWTVSVPELPPAVRLESLRRAAQFRMAQYRSTPQEAALLAEAFARPRPLREGAVAAGQPAARAWHLLWTGELTTDWDKPLLPTSMVWAAGKDNP